MNIVKSINIPEAILEKWDDKLLPPFELIYFADDMEGLPDNILVMPINEFKANPSLNSVDVNTTFTPWNIKSNANYVAVIENEQFDNLDQDLQQRMLQMQHNLGRGNIFEWNELIPYTNSLTDNERKQSINQLSKMSFQVDGETFVSLRRNHWRLLPWGLRANFLKVVANNYSREAIENKVDAETIKLSPFFQTYVERFPAESGANCFATALSGITEDRLSANWIIHQWIHPNTFLLSLKKRNYEKINDVIDWKEIDLQEKDEIVWVNQDLTPIHACAAIDDAIVFNKDGQTMFNPWLIRNFQELASTWNHTVQEGGRIHHYRKAKAKNVNE